MDPILLVLAVLDGIAYAALVFLVAVGLTLIFGVMRILNVAHGGFFAIGAYSASSLVLAVGTGGLSPWLSFPSLLLAAVLAGAALGLTIERYLLRRIYGKEQTLQLLVTFAVFMILEDLQRLIWGVQPYAAADPVRLLGTVDVLGIPYNAYQIILLPIIALLTLGGLRWFMRHTVHGKVIVAVAEDPEAAVAVGIDARKVFTLTFVLGAVLASLGGALASPTMAIQLGLGAETIVLSFAVVAAAGLGQVEGAAVTALLIGLGRSFAVYLAPELDVLVPYMIMVMVLLIRPQGLFGTAEKRLI